MVHPLQNALRAAQGLAVGRFPPPPADRRENSRILPAFRG